MRYSRRDFMKSAMVGVGMLAMPGIRSLSKAQDCQAVPKRLPNIIIIYADDMGYGDLACQNPQSKIPTPNLDKIAREGVRFTDAHSSSGVCTPSRYALLTGRYHWRDFHSIVRSYGPSKFKHGRMTLPEMLKKKGYNTACTGKWHLGWDWNAIRNDHVEDKFDPEAFDWSKPIPGGPLDHGFDYYFGDDVPNFPPYTWIENDRILIEPTVSFRPIPKPTEDCPGGDRGQGHDCRPGPMVAGWRLDKVMPKLTEKTIDWIKQQDSDTPFFLYWSWTSPHTPVVPTAEFQGKTDVGAYGDFMYQSDAHLGQVLQALKDSGVDENTLIIFSSDNGPEGFAYDRTRRYGHWSMGQLRGVKQDIWEGGHRVPFIVRWPGVIQGGRVNDSLISQIDLMATIASLVGYELGDTAAEDSFCALNVWLDNSDQTTHRDSHVHNTWRRSYAVRKDNWVLIDAPTGSHISMPQWFIEKHGYEDIHMPNGGLFNLEEDIGQRKNQIETYPQKVEELRTLLNEIRAKGHSAPRFAD